ncbi:ribonuclease P [Brachionus plicatilis]|uniref:Ribonuclease P n=1 Tax=Brachionus plicatilis TaxID=10195 RepID=A0A3M7R179_BRAPC|nr:ribonuclease P [Brachionus plicatilis]RNA17122.1 ribonuclease P [Brachionus plicatilis]
MESAKKITKKNVSKSKPKIELTAKCLEKSPQDFLFVNHVNYLNKLSFTSLTELDHEEMCRNNQQTIVKLVNKKPIHLCSELKYFHCKKCDIMLIPGQTSRIRVKSKRQKHIVSTCLNCGEIKRYNFR